MARHEVNLSRSIKPAASAENDRGGSREIKEAKSKALAARNAILKRHRQREASEADGAFMLDAPTKRSADMGSTDLKNYLAAKHGAFVERLPAGHEENPGESVVLRATFGAGDRTTVECDSGVASEREALNELADKIEALSKPTASTKSTRGGAT
jgi:hypothetical protein